MTATRTRRRTAAPPSLPDPGYGRRWEWELQGRRWYGSLLSRQGNVIGYIGDYDNGWGGNVRTRSQVRGRGFRPLLGSWATPEVAAEMLLRELSRP